MTFTRVVRWLLGLTAALVVIWSFFAVGLRLWREHNPNDHRVKLSILYWGDSSEDNIVRDLAEDYERDHPGISVERIHASDYDSKFKTMFAAGTPPDLFYLDHHNTASYAQLNLLENLDPLIKDLPDGKHWLDGYYPNLVNAFRFDGKQNGVGPLYGVPKDFTTMLMYVNVDLFQRAGLRVPFDGWTWDEFEADCKKITALSRADDPAGPIYGAVLNTWLEVLGNIIWSFGGDYFNGSNYHDVRFADPDTLAALEMIHRVRFVDHSVFNAVGPQKNDQGAQMFFSGRIGCIGPLGRWTTARYRGTGPGDPGITAFNWDVVPLPHEKVTVSDISVVAWSMSAQTKHPKEAFELLRFLCGPQGQARMARLGLAVPSLKNVSEGPAFLEGKPDHVRIFLDDISVGRVADLPPEQEFEQFSNEEFGNYLELNNGTAKEAAENLKRRWLAELASPLKSGTFNLMDWKRVEEITVAAIVGIAAAFWFASSRQKLGLLDRKLEREGWLFISPWLIGFVALTLGPIVLSLLLSFTRWTGMNPISYAEFVGLDNFKQLLRYDDDLVPSLRVTAYYALLMVPIGQIAALIVAMLMNARVRNIGLFRSIYYLPTLVGGVTMATMWLWLYDPNYGLINRILAPIAHWFGTTPPDWVGNDALRWGVPAFVIMGLWTVGGGMLIYLAALKNVPASLYEAARIDGASAIRQFFAVTMPMISPLIFFNVIIAIISSFQVFAQVYVMTNGGPKNATLFYVLYLYRQAFLNHNMGYASAMAWILFVIVLVLTGLVIRGSRRWVYYEGLKA
jgi:multiple sugar transport system permease protein